MMSASYRPPTQDVHQQSVNKISEFPGVHHRSKHKTATGVKSTLTVFSGSPTEDQAQSMEAENLLEEKEGSQTSPKPLRRARGWTTYINVLLLFLPLVFIGLGVVALRLNGYETSRMGQATIDFSKLSGTLYPIVFTCVVSRFLQNLARWHVERGATVGFLETLVRSQSFASSISTTFSLHLFNVTSFLVLLTWTLSPIGGQSSLRVLRQEMAYSTEMSTMYYADNNYPGFLKSETDTNNEDVQSVFQASLLTPPSVTKSPHDIWGHIKVPILEDLVHLPITNQSIITSQTDPNAWVTVVHSPTVVYNSLIGIPMWNLPSQGQFTFEMPWMYMITPCERRNITYQEFCSALNETGFPDVAFMSSGLYGLSCNFTASDEFNFFITSWDGSRLEKDYSNATYVTLSYIVAPYNLPNGYDDFGWSYDCELHSVRQDINVTCNGGNCTVDKVRRSTSDTRPQWVNPLNEYREDDNDDSFLDNFLDALVLFNESISTQTIRGASIQSKQDDEEIDNFLFLAGDSQDWTNVTAADFSLHLTEAWNSFYMALRYAWEATGDITTNIDIVPNNKILTNQTDSNFVKTVIPVRTAKEVYTASPVWAALLLFITLIVEVCAVLNIFISRWTLAPDVLGYVSSTLMASTAVRHDNDNDNDNDDRQPAKSLSGVVGKTTTINSGASGEERSRLLRNVKVQIADVRHDDTVGQVALTCVDGKTQQERMCGRLTTDRLYV